MEKCEIFLKICRITSRVRQEKSALTEAELVEAVRMGLREGQTEMVCRYAERVFAMVVRQVTDVMDAQELTQDTFLRAFSRIDSYDPQKASLSTWLCRIAYRLTLDFLKRRSPAIVSMEESSVWQTDISDELLEAELSTGNEERIGLLEQVMDSYEQNWTREYFAFEHDIKLIDETGHQYKLRETQGIPQDELFFMEGMAGDYIAYVMVFDPLPLDLTKIIYIEPAGEPFNAWGANWSGSVTTLDIKQLQENQKLFEYFPRKIVE